MNEYAWYPGTARADNTNFKYSFFASPVVVSVTLPTSRFAYLALCPLALFFVDQVGQVGVVRTCWPALVTSASFLAGEVSAHSTLNSYEFFRVGSDSVRLPNPPVGAGILRRTANSLDEPLVLQGLQGSRDDRPREPRHGHDVPGAWMIPFPDDDE